VLFADIRGFTAISERLAATTVIDVLNEYMDRMTNAILDAGGVVDKFIGDGIMALFLEDDQLERNAARRAIDVGVEMQRRARALAAEWRESRPEVGDFVIRVGINTGQVVAGNIGTRTRRDYTVVGDGVNVASRLEASAAGGQILVSEATFVAAGEPAATALAPLHVRNRQQPVAVYAVHLD
jgi:adenylate cyclase